MEASYGRSEAARLAMSRRAYSCDSLEPTTRHNRHAGEVLRARPKSTAVHFRVETGGGRPRCVSANEKQSDFVHQLATADYDRHNTLVVRVYWALYLGSAVGIRAPSVRMLE
jgi:hypothetical protein